ncbi:hypothetical protein SAMN06265795_103326 [Noviherbaspirillum humi]|uniref:Uncharacterized protein n=1 Tax=Noviherbaspirillum humi TaxID=1688639 RepID=A0A239FEK9_9BURK|nr:hypothetical protein [Noviherbaspirillum humi]SNS55349.1 hypothetical protein SAMN06265795_103326 [Noviherbaspirillum humi]
MQTTTFLIGLTLPIAISTAMAMYLRPILKSVLIELCGTEDRAEFWIRCSFLLSMLGGLIPVLAFIPTSMNEPLLDITRHVLMWSLVGAFVAVAWISRAVWKCVTPAAAPRAETWGTGEPA